MLTEDEERKLACSMALLDLVDQNKIDGHGTAELKQTAIELMQYVANIFDTLTSEETVQVTARYKKEIAETGSLKNHKPLFL